VSIFIPLLLNQEPFCLNVTLHIAVCPFVFELNCTKKVVETSQLVGMKFITHVTSNVILRLKGQDWRDFQ